MRGVWVAAGGEAEESTVRLGVTPRPPTPRSFGFAQDDMREAQDDRGATDDIEGVPGGIWEGPW